MGCYFLVLDYQPQISDNKRGTVENKKSCSRLQNKKMVLRVQQRWPATLILLLIRTRMESAITRVKTLFYDYDI
jgi:hypothetical protein